MRFASIVAESNSKEAQWPQLHTAAVPRRALNVAALAVFGLGVACFSGGAPRADTLDDAKKRGYIELGIANAAPWAEMKSDGTIGGAAPELAVTVLKQLGIPEVRATVVEFGAMIPGLAANRFDMVAAGLYLTPERCQQVLFSEPDLCGTLAFGVKKGNPMQLMSFEDVKNKKAKVGVCGGCNEHKLATEAGIPTDEIIIVPDETSAIAMLQSGRIDAYAQTSVTLVDLLRKANDPGLEMYNPVRGTDFGCGGAVFKKTDVAFRNAYDAELAKLKASGQFDAILNKYGFPVETAKSVTREKLCGGPN